jgi:hypothetical protein
LEQHEERILTTVGERPDATLEEILAALGKRGIHTSRSALDRLLGRHKITRKKKSLQAAEQKRKDVARARRKWIREQGFLDPAKLVFIDETSVSSDRSVRPAVTDRGRPWWVTAGQRCTQVAWSGAA